MNRQEAITALYQGKRLTWTYFTHDEWVEQDSDTGWYVFEDKCRCTPEMFWASRTDDMWDKGWSIYNNTT